MDKTGTSSKKRKKIINAISLLLLFFQGSLNVSAFFVSGTVIVITIILGALSFGVVRAILKALLKFASLLVSIFIWILTKFVALLLEKFVKGTFRFMEGLMQFTPRIYPFDQASLTAVGNLMKLTLKILAPFYILLLTLTGAYIIYVAAQPQARARAKAMFNKILISMFMVSASPVIYQVMIDIVGGITTQILSSSSMDTMSDYAINSVVTAFSNCVLIYPCILVILCAITIMVVRILMIYFCAIFFPLALFLYFFDFTKSLGANMLRFTMLWVGMPIVQSLMFSLTLLTVSEVGSGFQDMWLSGFMLLAGLIGLVVVSFLMGGLLKWVGGAFSMAGIGMMANKDSGLLRMAAGGALMATGSVMMRPNDIGGAIQSAGSTAAYVGGYRPGGMIGDAGLGSHIRSSARRGARRLSSGAKNLYGAASHPVSSARDYGSSLAATHRHAGGGFSGGWAVAKRVGGVFPPVRQARATYGAVAFTAETMSDHGGMPPEKPPSSEDYLAREYARSRGGSPVPGAPVGQYVYGQGVSQLSPGQTPVGIELPKFRGPDVSNFYGTVLDARHRPKSGEDVASVIETEWKQRSKDFNAGMGFFRDFLDMRQAAAYAGDDETRRAMKGASWGKFFRGVSRVGMSAAPVSPLAYTTRLVGTWISAFAYVGLPAGAARSIFMGVGKGLQGAGIRQTSSRVKNEIQARRNAMLYEDSKRAAERARSVGTPSSMRTALQYEAEADKQMDKLKTRMKIVRDGGDFLGRADGESYQQIMNALRKKHTMAFSDYMDSEVRNPVLSSKDPSKGKASDLVSRGLEKVNATRTAAGLAAYTLDDFEGNADARGEIIEAVMNDKDARKFFFSEFGWGKPKPTSTFPASADKKIDEPIGDLADPEKWEFDDKHYDTLKPALGKFLHSNLTKKGIRANIKLSTDERALVVQHAIERKAGVPERQFFPERTASGDWYMDTSQYKGLRQTIHQAGDEVQLYTGPRVAENVHVERNAKTGKWMVKVLSFPYDASDADVASQMPFGAYKEFTTESAALLYKNSMSGHKIVHGAGVAMEDLSAQWTDMDAAKKTSDYGDNFDRYVTERKERIELLRRSGGAMHQQEIMSLMQYSGMSGEEINEKALHWVEHSRRQIAKTAMDGGVSDVGVRDRVAEDLARGKSGEDIFNAMNPTEQAAFKNTGETDAEAKKRLSGYKTKFDELHSTIGFNGVRFEYQEKQATPSWVDPANRLLAINLSSDPTQSGHWGLSDPDREALLAFARYHEQGHIGVNEGSKRALASGDWETASPFSRKFFWGEKQWLPNTEAGATEYGRRMAEQAGADVLAQYERGREIMAQRQVAQTRRANARSDMEVAYEGEVKAFKGGLSDSQRRRLEGAFGSMSIWKKPGKIKAPLAGDVLIKYAAGASSPLEFTNLEADPVQKKVALHIAKGLEAGDSASVIQDRIVKGEELKDAHGNTVAQALSRSEVNELVGKINTATGGTTKTDAETSLEGAISDVDSFRGTVEAASTTSPVQEKVNREAARRMSYTEVENLEQMRESGASTPLRDEIDSLINPKNRTNRIYRFKQWRTRERLNNAKKQADEMADELL